MKRDTLNAIKFRGITSSVLAICCYLIIWVCCEFLLGITMSGFFTAAAAIVAIIFASMIFKLSATKMISDISASKVFRAYLINFIARVLWAIVFISLLPHSMNNNIVSLETLNYTLHERGGSFVEAFYCILAAMAIGLNHSIEIKETQFVTIWYVTITAFKIVSTIAPAIVYCYLGEATKSKIFYAYAWLYFISLVLVEIINSFIKLPEMSSATAAYIVLAIILLSEILEIIAWIRVKGISGAELWNKSLWATPTK